MPVHGTGSSLTEIVPLPVPGSCYGGSSSCYGEGNLGVLYFLLCFPKCPTWGTLWPLLPLGGLHDKMQTKVKFTVQSIGVGERKFMPSSSPGKFCMVVETFVRGDLKFETRYFVNQIQHGGVSGGDPLNLFPKRAPFRQPCKICPVRP